MREYSEFQLTMTQLLQGISLSCDEPLSKHTSFRIGGPAELMAFPQNEDELSKILKTAAVMGEKPRILGAGTNILAPDDGVKGLVICLKDCLSGIKQTGASTIRVMAGVTMTRAAVFAAKHGLSGLEFAHGIPGTVGGGVYMNAGAYGGEIKDVCKCVTVMDQTGDIRVLSTEEMGLSYRHSRLMDEPGIVISAEFSLTPADPTVINGQMQLLMNKRSASQPLDYPSAGSAFKRPVGGYAAALIAQAGLKGVRVGNAAVSEKHSGFIVNLGGAAAEDVKELLDLVACLVFEQTGIRLEPEIRVW